MNSKYIPGSAREARRLAQRNPPPKHLRQPIVECQQQLTAAANSLHPLTGTYTDPVALYNDLAKVENIMPHHIANVFQQIFDAGFIQRIRGELYPHFFVTFDANQKFNNGTPEQPAPDAPAGISEDAPETSFPEGGTDDPPGFSGADALPL